jgi:hypothetical protein
MHNNVRCGRRYKLRCRRDGRPERITLQYLHNVKKNVWNHWNTVQCAEGCDVGILRFGRDGNRVCKVLDDEHVRLDLIDSTDCNFNWLSLSQSIEWWMRFLG